MSVSSSSAESSPCPVSSSSTYKTSPESDTFTMVFLDFDDTLIPSRMYQIFANYLSIDIFSDFLEDKMSKLQHHIIECIESIRMQYAKTHSDHIEFCIVSNASQGWIDFMLKGSAQHNITSRLPILDEYLSQHSISAIAAKEKACAFLEKRFGEKAESVLQNTLDSSKENQFMWKYTTFALHISAVRRNTGRKCAQIISIGDGCDEYKALQKYSNTHHIKSLHVQLVRAPTINQLVNEWIYLKYNLWNKIKCKYTYNESHLFHVHDLSTIFRSNMDNNAHCTGHKHQLPAIHRYFGCWMSSLSSRVTKKQKHIAMEIVCKKIHQRFASLGLRSNSEAIERFKQIVTNGLCKNKEFDEYFKNVHCQKKTR